MARGRALTGALLAFCLLLGSCAGLGKQQKTPAKPQPSTAIAVSVLDDAIYLVDPSSGQRMEIVRGLTDFQSGFAAWAPDHTQLAYANHGIYLIDFHTDRRRSLITGDRLSMPTWSPSWVGDHSESSMSGLRPSPLTPDMVYSSRRRS